MEQTGALIQKVQDGQWDKTFAFLYPGQPVEECRKRYIRALEQFEERFGRGREALLVSAPGRTEIGGNHTDHQRGRVLAASVNLDILCVAAPNDSDAIRILSLGYDITEILLADLSLCQEEQGTTAALIRGVADWFHQRGASVSGFDAYAVSDVLEGSGLSSSAAFEVAVGNICNGLWKAGVSPVDIAIAGKYAENVHFGKPSGLMDQMACSVGGFVGIDFADPDRPQIIPVATKLEESGHVLCIVDTRGSHADLTTDYAAITEEMGMVAACFDKRFLREVDAELFYENIARVRAITGDRGVLRAIHFFADDRRVPQMMDALEKKDFHSFFQLVAQSGKSSFTSLQNVFSSSYPKNQGLTLALVLSEGILDGKGACRVHGGGFAGTIQAYVPPDLLEDYRNQMDSVFGPGACHVLAIRPVGGTVLTPDMGREV